MRPFAYPALKILRKYAIPAVFGLSAIILVLSGGPSSFVLSQAGTDGTFKDTYYVVSHFHSAVSIGLLLLLTILFYVLFERIFGVAYSRLLAFSHWACWAVGAALTILPSFYLMPLRYGDYANAFDQMVRLASIGSSMALIGCLFFLAVIFEALWRRWRD